MNRSEIRSQVVDNTGRSDKTTVINNMINAALAKVSAEYLWNDLLTEATAVLTIGTTTIALASDTRRLTEVRLMDGLSSYKISIREKSWVVRMYPDPTAFANAKPRFGYLEGIILTLVPPPDLAYTIRYSYYRVHPAFTDDVTNTLIPHADEAVIAWATYRTFKSIEAHEDAQQWIADYALLIRDAKNVDRTSAIQRVATARGIGDPVPQDYWIDPFVKGVP